MSLSCCVPAHLSTVFSGEHWHLRKTNWCGDPAELLADEVGSQIFHLHFITTRTCACKSDNNCGAESIKNRRPCSHWEGKATTESESLMLTDCVCVQFHIGSPFSTALPCLPGLHQPHCVPILSTQREYLLHKWQFWFLNVLDHWWNKKYILSKSHKRTLATLNYLWYLFMLFQASLVLRAVMKTDSGKERRVLLTTQ